MKGFNKEGLLYFYFIFIKNSEVTKKKKKKKVYDWLVHRRAEVELCLCFQTWNDISVPDDSDM